MLGDFVEIGWDGKGGLGAESNSTTLACPPDVANWRAVLPPRSGMPGLTSSRSSSSSTTA